MKKGFFLATSLLLVGIITAVTLCLRVLSSPKTVGTENKLSVVLDAGHGGIDGGVSGKKTGIKESDVNLSITHVLNETLSDMGFAVTLTRKTEGGLYGAPTKGFKRRDMQKRKEIIESAKPALVISIHQNYYPSSSTRGAQVFYNERSEEGKSLALCLQDCLNELYGEQKVKPRKATAGEYYMLECTSYPSVIVECGFLSNPMDETLLSSKSWQKKLSESIGRGMIEYFEKSSAVSVG